MRRYSSTSAMPTPRRSRTSSWRPNVIERDPRGYEASQLVEIESPAVAAVR
jgi:hypothetical protein